MKSLPKTTAAARAWLSALTVLITVSPAHGAPVRDETGLAFTGVKAGDGFRKSEIATLDELFLDALGRHSPVRVVGSSDIASMLRFEQQKQLLGCDEGSCMTEIAGAMGVSHVATATLGKLSGFTIVSLKVIRVDKAMVVARATQKVAKDGSLIDAVEKVVTTALKDAAIQTPAAETRPVVLTPSPPSAPHAALVAATVKSEASPTLPRMRWPWFVGAALAVGAGVALDTLPPSARDYRFQAVDLAPVLLYGAGAFCVWEGL